MSVAPTFRLGDLHQLERMLVRVSEHVLALLHQDVELFEQTVGARRIARRNVRRDVVAQKEGVHARGLDGDKAVSLARVQTRERGQRRAGTSSDGDGDRTADRRGP